MDDASVREVSQPLFAAKGWLKFLGILSIIYGILLAITIVGLLIAWLPIWTGVLLFQAATALEQANHSNDTEALKRVFQKLKLYFIILGVLALIGVVLTALSFIFGLGGTISGGVTITGA